MIISHMLAGSGLELRRQLGNNNVWINGWRSYSQQGDVTSAQWETPGANITTVGPNTTFPNGKLTKRQLNLIKKLIIFLFNGQSNDVGTVANMAGVIDPTNPYTQVPPIPLRYYCYLGGISPTQSGTSSPAVTDIINSANFASIVPAAVNINTLRTPGAEVDAQQWACSFGQVVAAALPADSAVLMIDVGHGGTSFTDDVQHAATVTSVSWAANVITFVFTAQTNIGLNDTFVFQNATNNNYNATWTCDVSSDGITVKVSRIGDPGAYTGTSGFGLVWSAPLVNARNMVRRAIAQIAPALGLTPYFGALCYNGNEASDNVNSVGAFLLQQFDVLQLYTQEITTLCGEGDSIIVWPQVGYPAASWQINDASLFNCAPNTTLGVLAASQDPTNKCITFGQYGAVAGGTGDVQAVACIHYGVQGHCDHGEIGANLWLDYKASVNTDPLQLLNGEGVMVRVANSKNVAATFNKSAVIDTGMGITDPGTSGYQFFTGVTNIAANDGGNGLSEAVTSVSVSTTTFGLTTTSAPTRAWGNFIGYGYNTATRFQAPNNTHIQAATWAATSGGQATYTTTTPHGLTANVDTVTVAQMVPIGFNVIPGVVCLTGTTGSTIVLPLTVNPGTIAISTSTWSGGTATHHTAAAVYTDGNSITVTGSSRSGYNTTGVITSHTGTSFTMAIADPGGSGTGGTVNGAGNVANNGTYGVGRTAGLRGTVRQTTYAHYSNNTGAPLLSSVAAIQFAQVDVYASTKDIAAALVELTL